MSDLPKLVVGQTVFSLNIGNSARRGPSVLTPVIVRSIGRKYFKCSPEDIPNCLTEYHRDTLIERTNYSATSCIYLTREERENEKEEKEICAALYKEFEYGKSRSGLSLETLRKIKVLLAPHPSTETPNSPVPGAPARKD